MPRKTAAIFFPNRRRIVRAIVCATFGIFLTAAAGVPADSASLARDSCNCMQSDARLRSHAIYAELLGSGAFYSLNYEYRVWKLAALRAGGGYMTTIDGHAYTNMMLLAMLRSSQYGNAVEIGAGIVGMRKKENDGAAYFGTAGALALGYCYQQAEDGLLVRVTFTPLFYKRYSFADWEIKHWRSMVGLSFGYAF